MTRVLTLQNNDFGPAGVVGEGLAELGLELEMRQPLKGDAVPAEPGGYGGLLVLGGAMHAGDEAGYPFLADEVRLITAFMRAGRPVLGICLGSQLLARACGQRVRRHHTSEMGFCAVEALPAAAADPLLHGLLPLPPLMQWHDDTFDVPDGAVHLASSVLCSSQAFRAGSGHYGLQFHLEVNTGIIDDWVADGRAYLAQHHPRFLASIAAEAERHLPAAQAFGREVGRRWGQMILDKRDGG